MEIETKADQEQNLIEDQGIFLPKFLFYSNEKESRSISPAARFDPISALNGIPFQNSTTPSQEKIKKKIIIDSASFRKDNDLGEQIALISRLQNAGFEIIIKSKYSYFRKLETNLKGTDLIEEFKKLQKFDDKTDYKTIAALGIASDQSIVLGSNEIEQIKQSLKRNHHDGKDSSNHSDQDFNEYEQYYFKLDASLNLAQKKDIITYAFDNGIVLWIDEINSCIDTGLEKVLNSVLTGVHPDTGKSAKKPGFIVLATANGIDLEERSQISPALLHRLHHPKVKGLKEYTLEDFKKIAFSMKSKEQSEGFAEKCATAFHALVQDNPSLNLRMFSQFFAETKEDNCVVVEEEKEEESRPPRPPRPLAEELQNEKDNIKIKSFFEKEILEHINKERIRGDYHKIGCEVEMKDGQLKIKLINNDNAGDKYTLKRVKTFTTPALNAAIDTINRDSLDKNKIIEIESLGKGMIGMFDKEITFIVKDKSRLLECINRDNAEERITDSIREIRAGCCR